MQAYASEVAAFVDAVANDKPVPVGIEAGLQSVLIGIAAKRSLELNRPVRLSEIEF